MNSTRLSITSKVTLAAIIGVCASMILLSVPQSSSAHGGTTEPGHHAKKTERTSTTTSKGDKTVDATCMQTAADAREDSLQSSWASFTADITTALGARKAALHDAWGLSDLASQKAASVKAWKDWKTASKAAHTELRSDRKTSWDAFKKTVKDTCKVSTPKEEGLEKDGAGSISL